MMVSKLAIPVNTFGANNMNELHAYLMANGIRCTLVNNMIHIPSMVSDTVYGIVTGYNATNEEQIEAVLCKPCEWMLRVAS